MTKYSALPIPLLAFNMKATPRVSEVAATRNEGPTWSMGSTEAQRTLEKKQSSYRDPVWVFCERKQTILFKRIYETLEIKTQQK